MIYLMLLECSFCHLCIVHFCEKSQKLTLKHNFFLVPVTWVLWRMPQFLTLMQKRMMEGTLIFSQKDGQALWREGERGEGEGEEQEE